MPLELEVNQKRVTVDVDPSMPLLWVLRETLQLTGTKYGCGMAQCGACTVHLDGHAVRSCVLPVASAVGKRVTTIEGLAGREREALEQAWIEIDVPQCGYCQPGQVMSAAVLLLHSSKGVARVLLQDPKTKGSSLRIMVRARPPFERSTLAALAV